MSKEQIYEREEWFRKETTDMEESSNKKIYINSLPAKMEFFNCLVKG
jgi:hypothetical protein